MQNLISLLTGNLKKGLQNGEAIKYMLASKMCKHEITAFRSEDTEC